MHWPELLIGGAIGVGVAIVIGYLFYVLQARREAPSVAFQSSSSPVVTRSEQEVGDLVVQFKGVPVPRLTRTRMAIWNPRWAIVDGADIAESDPLRITFRGADVLDGRVVTQTRPAISFTADTHDGDCFINFDFLDRHDGVVLELLHTAGETARPSVQGTIKGLPAGVSYYGELNSTSQKQTRERTAARGGPIAISFICFVLGVVFIVKATGTYKPSVKHAPRWEWYLAAGIVFAVGLMATSFGWSRRLPRTLARARRPERVQASAGPRLVRLRRR